MRAWLATIYPYDNIIYYFCHGIHFLVFFLQLDDCLNAMIPTITAVAIIMA